MEHIASILRNLQIDKEKWMRENGTYSVTRTVLEKAYMFSMVHIGDGDILGINARELRELLLSIEPRLHGFVYPREGS